jgi:hypothetical protein
VFWRFIGVTKCFVGGFAAPAFAMLRFDRQEAARAASGDGW